VSVISWYIKWDTTWYIRKLLGEFFSILIWNWENLAEWLGEFIRVYWM